MQLVREHINFERGLDPKKAMGIGREQYIKQQVKDLKGTVSQDKIDEVIELMCTHKGSYFDIYMDDRNKEELYFLFKLLGNKNIIVKTIDLYKYVSAHDRRRYGLESSIVWDNAAMKAHDKVIAPIYDKGGLEAFWEERLFNNRLEVIMIKYN